MPTHVEGEHVPAFTNPLTASSYLSHDNLPEGRVAQELISARDTQGNERSTRGQRSSADVTASPKDSIEDMVSRITIPENLPIQNLPVITAPELKLIGRCVDFCVKVPTDDTASVPYYYTGLVSMVTATTVALMYVNRYTREDFVQYKALQRSRANRDSGAAGDGSRAKRTPPPISKAVHALPTEADLEASATPHGESVFGALPVQPNSNEHEMGAGENRGPAATADAWGLCAGGAGAVHRGQRVRAFRGLSGSIGPIPYVTFLRKSIHDVEFGRGPHSSFYSLFQDPEKHMDDMQRLRMFVRRYLVHTSEGNNPRQVPLYAFLSVRCAWPNVDRELVNRLVPEELAALVKADRGIAEEKERKVVRGDQRGRPRQRSRAPAGLFSNTGILYITQNQKKSSLTGIVTLLFSVLFAVYFGLIVGMMSDALVVSVMRMFNAFFSVSLVVWYTAAIAIMLHASTGHIPLLADRFRVSMRVSLTMAAIGCSIMTILVMLWKMTNQELYDLMRVHHTDQVCDFYQQHACSGFLTACDSGMIDANLCFLCPDMPMTNTSCYASLWLGVQKALVPLLCFTCIILMATLYAAYLIIKLLFFVDVMMGQIV